MTGWFEVDQQGFKSLQQGKPVEFVRFIAKETLGLNISVCFMSWQGVSATFGNNTLTFNVKILGKHFFQRPMSQPVIDLILHEIAHSNGNHTESGYHQALSKAGFKLCILALNDPDRFSEWRG